MSLLRALFGKKASAPEAVASAAPTEAAGAELRAKGNAALAGGDFAGAERCYREAIAADSADPLAQLNLGFVLLQQGRMQEAQAHVAQALALQRPGDDLAHDAHFVLAQIHRQRGSREAALAALDAALAAKPDFAEALEDKAGLLLDVGRAQDALAAARRLHAVRPGPSVLVLESRALFMLGRHEEALHAIDAALADEPSNAGALVGRGNVLLELGRAGEALTAFEALIARDGADADRLVNVAAALIALGRFDEARERADAALELEPGHRPALVNKIQALRGILPDAPAQAPVLAQLAAAHRELGETAQAQECAAQAVERQPELAAGHLENGRALAQLGRNEEALAACLRACELDPGVQALETLAALYSRLRLAEEALETSVRAVKAHPDDLPSRSRELFFSNFSEATDVGALTEKHREYGRLLEARVPATYRGRWSGTRQADRRLRIGFVSSELYRHPVVLFLMPLLARIDRSRFDVFCYSTGHGVDETTAEIRSLCTGWVDARSMPAARLAAAAHADAIDILVDLSGHSGSTHLAVFAEKPAPVQTTWLGYLNTTGLTRIDYRLCDERTDPPSTQAFNTEQLLPFSASQWCYRPFVELEHAPAAPCTHNGFVTFGSFNNARKVSAAMCARWAQLLARCPGSRLMLADVDSTAKRERLVKAFEQHGIGSGRLEIVPRADVAGYHRLFDRVDIALDTYPYGGGTTTIDALWMGVPVVTAPGALPVSRSASSILQLLQLDEWVAPSIEQYVDVAVRAAKNPARIQELRATLRARLRNSPLMDEEGFARDFEAAATRAWRRFCEAG